MTYTIVSETTFNSLLTISFFNFKSIFRVFHNLLLMFSNKENPNQQPCKSAQVCFQETKELFIDWSFPAGYIIALSTILNVEIIPITKHRERLTFYKTWDRFLTGNMIWCIQKITEKNKHGVGARFSFLLRIPWVQVKYQKIK